MTDVAAPTGPASTPPLPSVPYASDALRIVEQADATHIMPAIAATERVASITLTVLENLGTGVGDGSTFADTSTMAERAAWIKTYAHTLLRADATGLKQIMIPTDVTERGDRLAWRLGAIARMLRALRKALDSSGENDASRRSITVFARTEEESAYSHDFPGTELEQQQRLCADLYARSFHSDFVPKIAVLKRICYAVRIDHKLAPLTRVPLSSLRITPKDPPHLLFKRWCVAHCIVAAGVDPHASFEDGGYGVIPGCANAWLSWYDCLDLLDTLEVMFVPLAEAAQTSVIESIIGIVSGSTGGGRPRLTASCAIGRAVSDAIRIIAAAAAADAGSNKRKANDEDPPIKLGPNMLERLKGGNPKGELCKDFARGKCPRALCSYSHVKPKPPASAEGVDAAGDGT